MQSVARHIGPTKLLCTCVTVGLFGVVALSREASGVTLPDLLFFHLLLQNELSQTRLNLHTNTHIHIYDTNVKDTNHARMAFGDVINGRYIANNQCAFMLVLVAAELKMISLTLLRCSSWSCFLFKASSSSSSLERLLPSDPTGAANRHKKLHETQRSAPIKTEAHLSGGNHASCQLDDEMLHPQFSF